MQNWSFRSGNCKRLGTSRPLVEALLAQDILGGAAVRDRPNLFVIGCYDRRITFYSQQVRALSLVHILKQRK